MRLTTSEANAQVLFHRESDLKVVTGQASSGVLYYSALVSTDSKSASVHKVSSQRVSSFALMIVVDGGIQEYHVLLQGPGDVGRRVSMMKLLEETERLVARRILLR